MNGAIDTSSRSTMTARLKTDGITVTRLIANASTGALSVSTTTTGGVAPSQFAATDENERPTLFAVSENDGVTPVALQCDSSGALLIKQI